MRRILLPIFVVAFTAAMAVSAIAAPAGAATAARGVAPAVRSVSNPGSVSPTLSVSSQLGMRRYVVAGDRAYDLGTEDGRFPAMGFHTRGEMGGIWTPPIKLLDGIWFGINGNWIGPATRFSSEIGRAHV